MVYKIDLHTHSIISPDGGISISEYEKLLTKGILDCIAVTDHNQITLAKQLQKQFGNKIIVGEEIATLNGEIIGLFLKEGIPPGLDAKETANAIHKQGGIVYIPHPFETLRQGIQREILETMKDEIDIIESFNGRGKCRGKHAESVLFAEKYTIPQAASSDAHGYFGIGKTFSIIDEMPTEKTITNLLLRAKRNSEFAPFWTFLYPSINRLKKKLTND